MIEHMGGFKCLLSLFSLLSLSPYSGRICTHLIPTQGLTKQELGAIIQGQSSHWPEYTFNTQLQQYEHDRCQRKQDTGDDMPALLPSAREFCVEHEHLYQCEKCQRKHQLQAASTFTCRVHPKHLPTHYMLEHEASTSKVPTGGHWLGKHPIPTPKTKGKKCQSKSAQDEIDKRFLELEELLRKLGYKYIGWEGKRGTSLPSSSACLKTPSGNKVARVVEAIEKAHQGGLCTEVFSGNDTHHCCGKYMTLAGGVSYGGGQKVVL
ncbi:hypothetical protein B0H10DRAFT_1967793 [Mycena sp. CBHHK59/15]|nr:hypothetical protein B0H10DRAFT_1967793 [Mycena sp. CBHHK59/15]